MWARLSIAAFAGTTAGLVWHATRHDNSLLSIARPVLPGNTFTGRNYCWLSSDELLRANKIGFKRVHLRTGATTELQGLWGDGEWPTAFLPSPDGQSLLWEKWRTIPNSHNLSYGIGMLTRRNGATERTKYFAYPRQLYWTTDSRSILYLHQVNRNSPGLSFDHASLYEVGRGRATHTVPIDSQCNSGLDDAILIAPGWLRQISMLNPTTPSLFPKLSESAFSEALVSDYKIDQTMHKAGERQVHGPWGAKVVGTSLSSDGAWIAWRVERDRRDVLLDWLHHLLPSAGVYPHDYAEIWVSRIDGRELHEIGELPLMPAAPFLAEYPLTDVRWLPGAGSVSFLYKGTLYRADAK